MNQRTEPSVPDPHPVRGRYFDVSQLARAKQLAEAEVIKIDPAATLLSSEDCAKLLEYTLAVTEFPATDPHAVTEVFRRINSYGRHLSSQERRQAGIVSEFATTVRQVAAELRGDVSSDSLDLRGMPEISIDPDGGLIEYAIKADNTFFVRQGILRRSDLRESEDEQLVADLAISILYKQPFAFSGQALDAAYNQETESCQELNSLTVTYGPAKLKREMVSTLSSLRDVIEAIDVEKGAFRRLVDPSSPNPPKTAFYAIFLAFFELIVREGKRPKDALSIGKALANIQGKKLLHVAAGQIRADKRGKNIATVKGRIKRFFIAGTPDSLQHGHHASLQFENALTRSRTESSAYECKQGLLRLDQNRTKDVELQTRIVQTICAIANIGPNVEGAIFLGVADKRADAQRAEELDRITSVQVGARYCVGIDREAKLLKKDIDGYVRSLVRFIQSSDLSEPLKTAVCSRCETITYRGLSVVCIWIPGQSKYSTVAEALFYRSGSETLEAKTVAKFDAVMQIFNGTLVR